MYLQIDTCIGNIIHYDDWLEISTINILIMISLCCTLLVHSLYTTLLYWFLSPSHIITSIQICEHWNLCAIYICNVYAHKLDICIAWNNHYSQFDSLHYTHFSLTIISQFTCYFLLLLRTFMGIESTGHDILNWVTRWLHVSLTKMPCDDVVR